jgi:hypothetical protein
MDVGEQIEARMRDIFPPPSECSCDEERFVHALLRDWGKTPDHVLVTYGKQVLLVPPETSWELAKELLRLNETPNPLS